MIFLVDECLHTGLVGVAEESGFEAHHVVYLGMQGWKDHEVLSRITERDYTFVTNNAVDFRRLYADLSLHAGLIIIVPNVVPAMQRELFQAVLSVIGDITVVNTVFEVDIQAGQIEVTQYELPKSK